MTRAFSNFDNLNLFDQAPIGIAMVSKDGTWLRVNDSVTKILGYSASEMEGKMNFQQVTHPADLDADVGMTNRVIAGDTDYYEMTKRYLSKSGGIIWVRLIVHAIRGEGDSFINFAVYILPILNGEKNQPVKPPVITNNFNIKKFIQDNWKWLLGALGAMVFSIYNFFVSLSESRAEIERMKTIIEKLENPDK